MPAVQTDGATVQQMRVWNGEGHATRMCSVHPMAHVGAFLVDQCAEQRSRSFASGSAARSSGRLAELRDGTVQNHAGKKLMSLCNRAER